MLEKGQGAIKPLDIRHWTLSEIALFLEDPKQRSPSGATNVNNTDLKAALDSWNQLSALDKLRRYEY